MLFVGDLWVIVRALPGDSQSLTVTGVGNSLPSVNRSKAHGEETVHERLPKPKPYEVGMQISRRLYSEVSPQGGVWTTAPPPGRGVPRVSAPEREPDRRGASAGRSGAYVAQYSAQVCGSASGGVSQR